MGERSGEVRVYRIGPEGVDKNPSLLFNGWLSGAPRDVLAASTGHIRPDGTLARNSIFKGRPSKAPKPLAVGKFKHPGSLALSPAGGWLAVADTGHGRVVLLPADLSGLPTRPRVRVGRKWAEVEWETKRPIPTVAEVREAGRFPDLWTTPERGVPGL